MTHRSERIKAKGFDMRVDSFDDDRVVDFSQIKVGSKKLSDANLNLSTYKQANSKLGDREYVIKAIADSDLSKMREISNFFYRTSGIYARLCKYLAYLYRYDWLVTPYYDDFENMESHKTEIFNKFRDILKFLDDFGIKKYFGEVALKIIRNGCYYGYVIYSKAKTSIQELPPEYCRSRFSINGRPVVEFNMRYFNDQFRDENMRKRVLEMFPEEFAKGYKLYLAGKLPPDFQGDTSGWYLLDPNYGIKFNINGEDFPPLISVIPNIIDLDEAQALDKKKMQQQLLKIIIQKMPLDKNGDLVFDVDEARELHNNAVQMLGKAIGVDVLTTFADVDVEDMAENKTSAVNDELEKVERSVYNAAGTAQGLFNTDGNLALEKSILNDEASMYNMLSQFESFLNNLITLHYKGGKKLSFRLQLLTTTIYNYKEMAKLYKEQTQLGYSKMLPQIALGQSQSSILNNAYFENDVLDLVNVFIPPLMSSVMNADTVANVKGGNTPKADGGTSDSKGGRPEKADDQKSDKTIANKESQS